MKIRSNCNINKISKIGTQKTNKETQSGQLQPQNMQLSSFCYKDYMLNKRITSFKGTPDFAPNTQPKTRDEFLAEIIKTNKYSKEETELILKMVDKIIENDQWEETDETLIYELLTSLANSKINSDINTLQKITDKICEQEQDDDYIEINPLLKGLSALCSNIDSQDYNFALIFDGAFNGILDCENTDAVYSYCDLIRDLLKETNTKKFIEFVKCINKQVSGNSQKLQSAIDTMKILSRKEGLKKDDLLDGLLLCHSENTEITDVKQRLNARKSIPEVFSKLNADNEEYYAFEKTFASSIEELKNRGFSNDKVAELLKYDDFFHKIMNIEHIAKTDPVILADFLETTKDSANYYDTMYEYTRSSSMFNNLLIEFGSDLSKFPPNSIFESDTGCQYTTETSKSVIKELSSFLEKQELKRDMTVYRGCGFGILNQKTLSTGENAGDAIHNAIKNNDSNKINQILKELTNSSFAHDNFLSTSFEKGGAANFIKKSGGILWKINAPKGSHGIYADPFNIENGLEKEILFNKGYTLCVKNAKADGKIVYIEADLL